MLKSIKVKNKNYKKFTDPVKQNELHIKLKTHRNSTVKLTRQFKEDYFKSYFEKNKKIGNGIRNLINIKNSEKSQQIALKINNQTIIYDFIIANQFDNFFTSIASKSVKKISPSKKTLISFLKYALHESNLNRES